MRKSLHAVMRAIYLFIFLIAGSLVSNAQNGVVEGSIKDAQKQALAFATVTIFKASDTSIVNYKLTDPAGKFRITQLPLNIELRILVSYTGFDSYRKTFTLSKESTALNLGELVLTPAADLLEDVVVTAERPPVVMRKDTIEFNAESFKTLPTAMVEDLLRKLPGVVMTEDGQFMVNGRKVNRILVDGREFFGNDLKATTKNLPAYTIDKVQVHNDERDLFDDPNRPPSEVGQVINLRLKKEYKKGMFGKLYAGAGTSDRHEIGGIVNLFRDTTQISFLGFSNNLSKGAFSMGELTGAGGFNRSGFNSIAITSSGGVALNGISFGGLGMGIETSKGAGININHTIGKHLDLNAQYFYTGSKDEFASTSVREQFVKDTVLTTSTRIDRVTRRNSHMASLRAFWKIDSLTRLEFTPKINATNGNNIRPEFSLTNQNFEGKLNESTIDGRDKQYSLAYNHYLNFNKKMKKGFSLNISNYTDMDSRNDVYINKLINSYIAVDTLYQNRKQDQDIAVRSVQNYITLAKVINKSIDVSFRHKLEWKENRSGIYVYDALFSEDLYNVYLPDLSNDYTREDFGQEFNGRLNYKLKKFTFSPGISYVDLNYTNNFTSLGYKQKNNFGMFLPSVNIRYGNHLSMGLSQYMNVPTVDKMQPVVNANNPMNIIIGDPNLRPGKTTSASMNLNVYTNPKFTYSAYVSAQFLDDAIVSNRSIDALGNQTTRWIQLDGNKNFFGNFSANKIFTVSTKNKFTVGMSGGANHSENRSILNSEIITSLISGVNFAPRVMITLGNLLDFSVAYNHNINYNRFENQVLSNFTYVNKNIFNELTFRPGKHFVFNSKYTMHYRQLTGPDMPKYVHLWNIAATYQFMESQRAQITLSVFDALKSNRAISRTIQQNYILDVNTTVLQQYFLLTFSYNIKDFKSKSQNSMFGFW
ncbi:outer membrane beta-barrel protein [Gynurincola endophyticus]|uniref:outer membrane beta-barrel protein n=1 Tax=Gynurincola endophyticus TaxID=2479004 RepID=UPI000F8DECC1|nr:outer membrane beta-barrel protein [Gynurincola endophyticus]